MKWEKATLIANVKSSEDELGNSVFEQSEILTVNARFSPWTENQIALEGRDITSSEMRVIIPISYSALPKFDKIKIKNILYLVKQKMDLSPRFTMLQIKEYRNGKDKS